VALEGAVHGTVMVTVFWRVGGELVSGVTE